MGFLKWIRTEIDATNIDKMRSSKYEITENMFSPDAIPDEAYTRALSKFNEWRRLDQFGTLSKKNQKQFEKMSRKLEIIKNKKATDKTKLHINDFISCSNDFYEEIDKHKFSQTVVKDKYKHKQNKINKDKRNCYTVRNLKNIDEIKNPITNNTVVYENRAFDFESQNRVTGNAVNVDTCNKEFQYISIPGKFDREAFNSFQLINQQSNENNNEGFILNNNLRNDGLQLYQTEINNENIVAYSLPIIGNSKSNKKSPQSIKNKNNTIIKQHAAEKNKILDEISFSKNQRKLIQEKSSYDVDPQITSVIVTDLDKSDEKSGNTNFENDIKTQNIMKDLDILENWSKSIEININTQSKSYKEDFHAVIICPISEVKITSFDHIKLYGSRIYPGTFRGSFISQQKKEHGNNSFRDEAILLTFEKLRRLRHPDIALLMAVTTDSSRKLNSLILEAFECSLNNEIHKTDNQIPLNDVIKYSIQLTRAVMYCHEYGMIHSNICSESILVSRYGKNIKIYSFELATACDNNARHIENTSEKETPPNFLPHLVKYRQNYSNHCYQSPELITTKLKYVYPTKQSDIYGICLTLWEMLNKSVPFAFFNYKDLENLFCLQNTMLPIFEKYRCKQFKYILEKGLQLSPENRIECAENILILLMQLSEQVSTSPIVNNVFEESNLPSPNNRIIYDKTSTVKRRKINDTNLYEYTNTTENVPIYLTPQHITEDSNGLEIKEIKSNINDKIFEINDYQLPSPPIARRSQLLKNAWLLKEKLSPIQKLDHSENTSNSTTNLKQLDKIYNVKIRVLPKDNNMEELSNSKISDLSVFPKSQINNLSISNQINYWNSINSPPIENNLLNKAKQNQVLQKKNTKNVTIDNINKQDSTDCMLNDNHNLLPIPLTDLLQESFGKRCRNSSNSFEDSLWKREKKICQSFNVYNKNNSVKDTVNKFESFSNNSQQHFPNAKLTLNPFKLTNNKEIILDNSEPTTIVEKENNLENCDIKPNNLQNCKIRSTGPKKIYKSNLDVVLDKTNIQTDPDSYKESNVVKLNFRNEDRRASDISWFCRHVRSVHTKGEYERHSVCGTELLKQLGKFTQQNRDEVSDKFIKKYNIAATTNVNPLWSKDGCKLQVGKLTCWNCGCKVFLVNDRENDNQRAENIINLPLSVGDIQNSKSTEDLYIDDDFCQDIVLGANMELGSENELNYFDFSLLSAENFNIK